MNFPLARLGPKSHDEELPGKEKYSTLDVRPKVLVRIYSNNWAKFIIFFKYEKKEIGCAFVDCAEYFNSYAVPCRTT